MGDALSLDPYSLLAGLFFSLLSGGDDPLILSGVLLLGSDIANGPVMV
ncbi:MAG: hypothetical protein V1800_14885 [Candidatus Latescibacterota bacterium]